MKKVDESDINLFIKNMFAKHKNKWSFYCATHSLQSLSEAEVEWIFPNSLMGLALF